MDIRIQNFANELIEKLNKDHPEIEYELCRMTKRNDIKSIAMKVPMNNGTFKVFYFDNLYDNYKDNIDEAINYIVTTLKNEDKIDSLRICVGLINTEKNKKYLFNKPHIDILDLSIIFRLICGSGSVVITNDHMNQLNLSTNWLFKLALKNTEDLYPVSIRPINLAISEFIGLSVDNVETEADKYLYIANNKDSEINMVNSVLFSEGLLMELANKFESDLYLIPSSICEFLILPTNVKHCDLDMLKNLCCDVNKTIVAKDLVLSDNIYHFERKGGMISIAK